MRHLIETNDLSNQEIKLILQEALNYLDGKHHDTLKDRVIITVFFENSTRTLSSFEVAAKRMGAEVVRLDVARSSTKKGETIYDTAANLNAMLPSAIVVRHKHAGVPHLLSQHTSCPIINGGDGANAHPTQALLDLLTLKRNFNVLEGKKIVIVGDIRNSRVANSNINLLQRFGMEVILAAPPHFTPKTHLKVYYRLEEAIKEADAIMSLRTQVERHSFPIYGSLRDYGRDFCITKKLLKDRNIILLHPGPVHRNIDIDDEMLKDPRCKVLEQVTCGVAVRMAVLKFFIMQ